MKPTSGAVLRVLSLPTVALIAALALAACGSSSSSGSGAAASAARPAASKSSALTIATASGSAGTYLVGAGQKAVYLWVADPKNKSTCSGACAGNWPPVTASGKVDAGHGASATALGTIMRANGAEQVTYDGHPLYYFAGDTGAGQTTGQGSDGFGAKWWLVSTRGKAITGSGASASSSGSSSAGYSSNSGGY